MGKKLSEPLEDSIRPIKPKFQEAPKPMKFENSKKQLKIPVSPIMAKLEMEVDGDMSYPLQNSSKRTVYVNRYVCS